MNSLNAKDDPQFRKMLIRDAVKIILITSAIAMAFVIPAYLMMKS